MRRFLRDNQEELVINSAGQVMTRWEHRENQIQSNIVIRRINREIRKLNEPLNNGYSRVQMGSREAEAMLAQIRSIKSLNNKRGFEYDRIRIRLEDLGRSDYNMVKSVIYRENFMKALESSSSLDGYDLLVKKLNSIKNPIKFYEYIQKSNVFSDLFLYYKPR